MPIIGLNLPMASSLLGLLGIGHHDHRQTEARKAEFLEQVGIFEEGVLRAADDFRKQTPCQDACAQINAVGKGRIHPWQFGAS